MRLVIAAIALLAAVLVLEVVNKLFLTQHAPSVAPLPPRDATALSATTTPSSPALPGLAASADLTLPPGAHALAALPADLPLMPGAKKLLSFERTEGGFTEQQGVWSIPGVTPTAVLDFYQHAAEERGFSLPGANTANPAAARVMNKGSQQLLLRATSATDPGSPVRLTVIFRYTNPSTR